MSTLTFLALPPKTFVGIDLLTFNSSPHFHGIKSIPPGFHLLYTGTDASLAIRHGRWFHVSAVPHTLVWRWDPEDESLELLPVEDVVDVPSSGVVDYQALQNATVELKAKQSNSDAETASDDAVLIPTWAFLTSKISSELLDRVLPEKAHSGGAEHDEVPRTTTATGRSTWAITSLSSTPADSSAHTIPGLSPAEASSILSSTKYSSDSNLVLLPIDLNRTFPPASTGRERTSAARDRSWYLSQLIDNLGRNSSDNPVAAASASDSDTGPKAREFGARHLIGELQLTFLAVLTLSNYSCLEGWKRILEVMLTCASALREVPEFFTAAVLALRAQVSMFEEVEGGLFELSDENGGAWLRKLLRRFRVAVDEAVASSQHARAARGESGPNAGNNNVGRVLELDKELARLETIMEQRYGWSDVGANKILRRGKIQLEDGEEVEVQMDGFDEEEETGDWAPIVVDLS